MFCRAIGLAVVAVAAAPFFYEAFPPRVHDIAGKCAVVTGASTGIGVYIAERLAKEGVSKLILAARSERKLKAVARNISELYPGTQVYAARSDVSLQVDQAALAKEAQEKFGDGCKLILVNNAGVFKLLHFERAPPEKIDSMLDINLKGLIHLTRHFMPSLVRSGGHVVNIASLSGKTVGNSMAVYGATKHGIVGFTAGMRAEMRYKQLPVTFHSVLPGIVLETGMAHDNGLEAGLPLSMVSDAYGWSYPADTADAVVRAIVHDSPEILVNFPPMRPILALGNLLPRFWDSLIHIPVRRLHRAFEWCHGTADVQT